MRAALLEQADTTVRAQLPNVRAVLVVRNGYLVFERYYAGSDRGAIYNVQSITKIVTSAVFGIALERTLLLIRVHVAIRPVRLFRIDLTDREQRQGEITHFPQQAMSRASGSSRDDGLWNGLSPG